MVNVNHAIDKLLERMVTINASDLHLVVGSPPTFRTNGTLTSLKTPPLKPEMVKEMVYAILTPEQKEKFEKEKELDFSYSLPIQGERLAPERNSGCSVQGRPYQASDLR